MSSNSTASQKDPWSALGHLACAYRWASGGKEIFYELNDGQVMISIDHDLPVYMTTEEACVHVMDAINNELV